MRIRLHLVLALALAVAAACMEPGPTSPDAAFVAQPLADVSGVVKDELIVAPFSGGPVIPGAAGTVLRGKNGVNASMSTHGLTPGHAYTLWVVVFNHPAECTVPNACSVADALANDPAVAVDLIFGGGHAVGGSGKATFAGRVGLGDLGLRGYGLLDILEPEIHLVVRDHGPKLPGNAQLSEFGGGCDVYACANVQAAFPS